MNIDKEREKTFALLRAATDTAKEALVKMPDYPHRPTRYSAFGVLLSAVDLLGKSALGFGCYLPGPLSDAELEVFLDEIRNEMRQS